MTILDIIIILTAIAGAVIGYMRGFFSQMISCIGIVMGVVVCNLFGNWAVQVFQKLVPESESWVAPDLTTVILALSTLFLLVYFSVEVIATYLHVNTDRIKQVAADKVLGVTAGVAQYIFVASLVLNLWLAVSPESSIFSTRHALDNKPFELVLDTAPFAIGMNTLPSDSLAIRQNVTPLHKTLR